MNSKDSKYTIAVIGGGFTGLSAAYELSTRGIKVIVFEKNSEIGGLAGCFKVNGASIEKFYHHCFNHDQYFIQLAKELKVEDQLLYGIPKTGNYINKKLFDLSKPLALLNFKPLSFADRIRLGLLALKARKLKNWKKLESVSAKEWLIKLGGQKVYEVVWEPLLTGKFGDYAPEISAVWLWNKLVLRGSSRNRMGTEQLIYYKNSFGAFAEKIKKAIEGQGGILKTNSPVNRITVEDNLVRRIHTPNEIVEVDAVIATPALTLISELLEDHTDKQYIKKLRRIKYLSNICLVLELSTKLSDIYWLNVYDKNFPFIGIIEHTNFQPAGNYGNSHIVYLSKYVKNSAEFSSMSDDDIFKLALLRIHDMFQGFSDSMVKNYHVFRAPYAQNIVEHHYSDLLPANKTPLNNFYIASMAQIYPEDRGINYAIREGRKVAKIAADKIVVPNVVSIE